jgi:DNA uptake protein ComE-like DNA-binding protein
MTTFLVWLLAVGYTPKQQLDLNNASLAQIESLPVPGTTAQEMFLFLGRYGPLTSIYELRRVKSLSAEDFEAVKLLIKLVPREYRREQSRYVHRVERELAAEESPTEAAVEEWQDLVMSRLNINKAGVDDLVLLPNVSIVDAAAVVNHTRARREIKGYRELRSQVEGLSDYGYRNMRNYVDFRDPPAVTFDADYRMNYDYREDWLIQDKLAYLNQNLSDLAERAKFRRAGFSDAEIDYMVRRLEGERSYLAGLATQNTLRNRFRGRVGDNLRLGFRASKDFGQPGTVNEFKGFAGLYDYSIFKKVFVGDYRMTVGQGLMIDNSRELNSRYHERTQGVFNDLTPTEQFGFRGAALETRIPYVTAQLMYSRNGRDGIENPDGTINYYALTDPRLPANQHNFTESNLGGSLRLNLDRFGFFPTGTYLGLNGLTCDYDKTFNPDPKWIDLPGDDVMLDDPNYTQLTRGRARRFYGLDFRSVVNNLSLEGEWAQQYPAGAAYLFKARMQYDYLYLVGLFRHYDVNYDNPYNRGFCEMRRFEDTPLEKTYRIIDPTLVEMMNFPTPKAEEGFYLEARYQVSRQVTFTRAYVDIWKNLALGLNNYRFQGEVEYRPVFPLRLRLKQKIQEKNLAKDVSPTTSRTWETSLRALVSLPGYDFLTAELRTGRVLLTPSMAYNSNTSIWGGFLSATWEHNFTDDFSTELGVAAWKTDGMSQWIFDDVGIDFLDGNGMKYYITASDRLSDYILIKLKFRQKLSEYAHTGLTGPDSGLHFGESGAEAIHDFTALRNSYYVGLQLDLLF